MICVLIGVSSSLFDCFRFYPVLDQDGLYTLKLNDEYMSSIYANFLAQLRNAIRALAVLALVSCNAVMIILYRNFTRKVGQMTSMSSGERKRRRQQKVLIILAIFESFFNVCETTLLVQFYILLYLRPSFYYCQAVFLEPLYDGLIEVFDISDFYTVFVISKGFRQMIFESVPCLKRFADPSVPVNEVGGIPVAVAVAPM